MSAIRLVLSRCTLFFHSVYKHNSFKSLHECRNPREKKRERVFFSFSFFHCSYNKFISFIHHFFSQTRGVEVSFEKRAWEKMNMSASQCGSGCESGWTLYLDQSSYSQTRCQKFSRSFRVEDEEQDLSMVSDASSGPRHYCQDYEECLDENGSFCSAPAPPEPAKKSSKNKKKIKEHGSNQQHSYLDDTASSPVISFTKASSTAWVQCSYCIE